MAVPLSLSHTKKNRFLDFFPVPLFLLLGSGGISINDEGIGLVEFKKGVRGHYVLKYCVEYPLPVGAVVGGSIVNKEPVIAVLKEMKKKYRYEYVYSTLPEEKAYLFTTEVENVKPEDLRDVVAFTIEENAPVTLATSIFDFDIISVSADRQTLKVAVSVLPVSVVDSYIDVFKTAGITPVSFDIESQAIVRALVPRGDERSHLIVNVGKSKIGLYVAEDEVAQWSSTIAAGANDLRSEGGAAKLKTEMRKLFAFWNTRTDKNGVQQKRIEKIIFSGSGASDDSLIASIMFGVEIEYGLANVWVNAFSLENHIPDIPFKESLRFAAAAGAGLRPISTHHV